MMGKQSKSRKPDSHGKGKVTPVQIAFIVDRYLSDNNFVQTRSAFRTEAPDLISRSPIQEAPKTLLSLAAILDEYIRLKEQKVLVDQEKTHLDQERFRIQSLLSGVQDAMNSYTSGGSVPLPSPMFKTLMSPAVTQSNANSVMRMDLLAGSSPAVYSSGYPAYIPPNTMIPMLKPNTIQMEQSNMSTPVENQSSKRKRCLKNVTDPSIPSKRTRCRRSTTKDMAGRDNSTDLTPSNVTDGQPLSVPQLSNPGNNLSGSGVVKRLFNKNSQTPITTSIPNTPPRSTTSQTDNSISPVEISSTNCIVIVSPNKKVAYYSIERNQSITASSPDKTNLRLNKRDHVKGRLDFGEPVIPMDSNILSNVVASTSEPDNGGGDAGGIFDLELPNFENFGLDFSFGDLFVDVGIDTDFSAEPESHSGSPDNDTSGNLENSDLMAEEDARE